MAGEAYSGSEYDVEQQMYQAMASKMQSDGVDVTAEEIAQTIDEQSSPNPPEPSEKDEEIMAQMAAYQAEHYQPSEAYVVRGALLHCQYGSHCRRMNLPRCHGSFTGEAASGTVTGTPGIPDIIDVWDGTHAETHIGKENEEALTTRSFLVCSYGGLIEIIRSGQEDND